MQYLGKAKEPTNTHKAVGTAIHFFGSYQYQRIKTSQIHQQKTGEDVNINRGLNSSKLISNTWLTSAAVQHDHLQANTLLRQNNLI